MKLFKAIPWYFKAIYILYLLYNCEKIKIKILIFFRSLKYLRYTTLGYKDIGARDVGARYIGARYIGARDIGARNQGLWQSLNSFR